MNNSLPPPVDEPLYQQIQRLKNQARKSTKPEKLVLPTLEQRLLDWISLLSPAQIKKPYTTIEVIKLASLTGRHRSHPALQEVAQLLRKHGFESKRSWVASSYNRRYWKFKGSK
jgi:hypothetical protein